MPRKDRDEDADIDLGDDDDDDDDDVEEEEEEEEEDDGFIVHDENSYALPTGFVWMGARMDDIVAWVEKEVRGTGVTVPGPHRELMDHAEVAYRKLAADMGVLSKQAESLTCKGFSRLIQRAHSARESYDACKSQTREKARCAACGRTEFLCDKRLDLVGDFPMANFSMQDYDDTERDVFGEFRDAYYDNDLTKCTDHGIFYLGKDCHAKTVASFMLRTYVSDLFMDVQRAWQEVEEQKGRKLRKSEFATGSFNADGFRIAPAYKALFEAYPARRQMLEKAAASKSMQHVQLPVLTYDDRIFRVVDNERKGYSADDLCARGLQSIEERSGEYGEEEEPRARQAPKDSYGRSTSNGAGPSSENGPRPSAKRKTRSEADSEADSGAGAMRAPRRAKRIVDDDDEDEPAPAPAASPVAPVVAPVAPVAPAPPATPPVEGAPGGTSSDPPFARGQRVWYKDRHNSFHPAQIEEVHVGGDPPTFVVMLRDGSRRDTIAERLVAVLGEKAPAPPPAPAAEEAPAPAAEAAPAAAPAAEAAPAAAPAAEAAPAAAPEAAPAPAPAPEPAAEAAPAPAPAPEAAPAPAARVSYAAENARAMASIEALQRLSVKMMQAGNHNDAVKVSAGATCAQALLARLVRYER